MVKRIRYYLYIIGLGCMTGWSFIALLFWSKQIDFNPIIYSTQYFYVWGSLYIGLPLGCSILWSITLRRINEKAQKTIYICTSIWFGLFLLLIGWNKMYWNYYFKRPHPFSELQASKNIQQCFSVSNIDYTIPSGRKSLTFSFTPPHKKSSFPPSNHYYNFYSRGFQPQDKCTSNKLQSFSPHQVKTIENQLTASDIIVSGGEPEGKLSGSAFTFTQNRLSYLFLGLSGGQIANDHYVYYEFLFMQTANDFQLKKTGYFFYDVAGIEHLEFSTLAPIFSTVVFVYLLGCLLLSWVMFYV